MEHGEKYENEFEIIGIDTCCYTNNDIGRKEVRIDLGYFFHRGVAQGEKIIVLTANSN